jgi:DNA mismatch repair ATPase MutS
MTSARSETGPYLSFQSVLYQPGEGRAAQVPQDAPAYFRDLNLDQIVATITTGREEYDLRPFFHAPLRTVEAIRYRQEVMRDVQNDGTRACITNFAAAMRQMRERLAQAGKLHYQQQKDRWYLHAVETYCHAVQELRDALSRLKSSSRGLTEFRTYAMNYAESDRFLSLLEMAEGLRADLAAVRYTILIKGAGLKVRRYCSEPDYSEEIAATFAKFRQGAVKEYLVDFHNPVAINHVEAKVLEFVALLHRDVFARLETFVRTNQDFADPILTRFDREVQFYVAFVEYMASFERAGLRFCFPVVSDTDKTLQASAAFDLALATKLISTKAPVVCNDLSLGGQERILVVSGPNQGGKTTFARTFGQLHHLASIGCPVAGQNARLFLFDALFTHFEREEDIETLHGKLQDDLIRIHDILEHATSRSIVIINEIFNGTALHDAVFLARRVFSRLIDLDLLGVCATFLDELSTFSPKTVSMVSTVMPHDPAVRTFKVVRRPADGRDYAISIAEKYRLTYEAITQRISTGQRQP